MVASARPSRNSLQRSRRKVVAERWWTADDDCVHDEVWKTVELIRRASSDRRRWDRHHMALYANLDVTGTGTDSYGSSTMRGERSRFNIVKQAVDTAVAMLATKKPKPMYVPMEGDFSLLRQARLKTRVIEGQLLDSKAYSIMRDVYRRAYVLGCSHAIVLDGDDGPELKPCLPGTVFVDHRDGMDNDPYALFYRFPIARDVLMEKYPEHAKLVEKAAGPSADDKNDLWLQRDTTVDDVVVVFAWRRPTKKGSSDGRFTVSVSTGTLYDDKDWKWSIPVVKVDWERRLAGYWSAGISEAGRDPQARINRMIKRGEKLLDLGANAMVMADRNAKFRVEQMTNEPLKIIHYTGGGASPPQIVVTNPKPVQIDEEVDRIREQFFAQLGISQMQAENKVPQGITGSGAAQRTYHELSNQRHQVQSEQVDDDYMRLVQLYEESNERMQEKTGGYTVAARTTRGRVPMVQQVKWSAAKLPENKYRLQCWPTSQLPSTPSGRMAMVQEWIASGWISRPWAMSLMDIPDTDHYVQLELAYMDAIAYDIERMLEGEPAFIEPAYMDLDLAVDMATRSYNQLRTQNAPEEIKQLLRDYIDDCMAEKESAAQASAPSPVQDAQANTLAMAQQTQQLNQPQVA